MKEFEHEQYLDIDTDLEVEQVCGPSFEGLQPNVVADADIDVH